MSQEVPKLFRGGTRMTSVVHLLKQGPRPQTVEMRPVEILFKEVKTWSQRNLSFTSTTLEGTSGAS